MTPRRRPAAPRHEPGRTANVLRWLEMQRAAGAAPTSPDAPLERIVSTTEARCGERRALIHLVRAHRGDRLLFALELPDGPLLGAAGTLEVLVSRLVATQRHVQRQTLPRTAHGGPR